jgi:hypothetical protein
MSDPLPLAFLVAGALALVGTAVTVILWRTVHGHHRSEERRDARISRLYEAVVSGRPIRHRPRKPASGEEQGEPDGARQPLDPDALRQELADARNQRDTKRAFALASGLAALDSATEEEFQLVETTTPRDPVDSHRWKRIGDQALTSLVFSPHQDPTLDALFATISPTVRRAMGQPPEKLGLDDFLRCRTAEEGPEIVLTLQRCARALGFHPPRIYVDESLDTPMTISSCLVSGRPEVAIVVGRPAALLPTTAQRAFLCGAKLALLHPAVNILTQVDDGNRLHGLLVEADAAAVGRPLPDARFDFLVPALEHTETGEMFERIMSFRSGKPTRDEVDSWLRAARETTWRIGLLFARDLREAKTIIRDTLGMDPASARRTIENLVRFRLSTSYARARKELV